MTHRFKTALVAVGALAFATLAIYFVLGSGDDVQDGTEVIDRPDNGEPTDPDNPRRLGGNGDTPGTIPGTGPGMGPGDGPGGLPHRVPEGPDYSDPAQVEEAMARLLSDRPIDWAAVARLAQVYDGQLSDDVRRALMNAIRHGDRTGALRVLTVTRDGTLVQDLFRVLDDRELTPGAKSAIYQALGVLPGANDAEVIRGLEARLTGQDRYDLHALKAIGRRGGREGARAIVDYLARAHTPGALPAYGYLSLDVKEDREAARVVAEAMGQANSPEVLQALIKLSAQAGAQEVLVDALRALDHAEQTPSIREDLLQAMSRIGTESAVGYVMNVAGQPGKFGEQALTGISHIRSATPEARQLLVNALRNAESAPDPLQARRAYLQALGNLKEKSAMPDMVTALTSTDETMRHVGARGLGSLGRSARDHVPDLITAFSVADEKLQSQIAVALGGIGGDDARSALEQMTKNADLPRSVVRNAAMAHQRLLRTEAREPKPSEDDRLGGSGR